MERITPMTGNKDADLLILSKLDDKSLLSFCASQTKNKNVHKLCNDKTFWRNRFIEKYSPTSEWSNKKRNWKRSYLKLTYYLNKGREANTNFNIWGNEDFNKDALYEASLNGDLDIVEYLISETDNWLEGLRGAIESNNHFLINFFIQNGKFDLSHYDTLLASAVKANNRQLVDYYIQKGATKIYWAIHIAFSYNNFQMLQHLYDVIPGGMRSLTDETLQEKINESLQKYGPTNEITRFYLDEHTRREEDSRRRKQRKIRR